eukprot:363941-Chlamydomonas_euryale.AAC.23
MTVQLGCRRLPPCVRRPQRPQTCTAVASARRPATAAARGCRRRRRRVRPRTQPGPGSAAEILPSRRGTAAAGTRCTPRPGTRRPRLLGTRRARRHLAPWPGAAHGSRWPAHAARRTTGAHRTRLPRPQVSPASLPAARAAAAAAPPPRRRGRAWAAPLPSPLPSLLLPQAARRSPPPRPTAARP